jgi:hypothetical protein
MSAAAPVTAKPATASGSAAIAPAAAASAAAVGGSATILPTATALLQAAKLGIEQDKPIKLDFFVDSATNKAFIGEDTATKQRVLIKSKEEFTSTIQKLYKAGEEYIILTENSIYLASVKVQKRAIDLAKLQAEADKIEYDDFSG